MDRVANLVKTSSALRRQVFASMSWGARVAEAWMVLSSASIDAFGNAIYAEFLKAGVPGMPDPGPRWNPKSPRAADTLPRNYGREFGTRAYRLVIKLTGNPERADDVMMDFLVSFVTKGAKQMNAERGLKDAENYVLKGLANQAKMSNRQKTRSPESLIFDQDARDDDGPKMQFKDDNALYNLDQIFPMWRSPQVLRALDRVHPDAALYLKLLLEGYDESEIIGDYRKDIPSMLPTLQKKPITPQAWNYRTKPAIRDTLRQFM